MFAAYDNPRENPTAAEERAQERAEIIAIAQADGNGGETDWAGIVGAALGGTAAIIRAAEGSPAPRTAPAPTFDPYAQQKQAAGVPMWVWLGGGALVLVVLMGQRK